MRSDDCVSIPTVTGNLFPTREISYMTCGLWSRRFTMMCTQPVENLRLKICGPETSGGYRKTFLHALVFHFLRRVLQADYMNTSSLLSSSPRRAS